MLLPSLANLSISNRGNRLCPEEGTLATDVIIDELPGALLGKVLEHAGNGSGTELCSIVDALSRTSSGMRDSAEWYDIALQFGIPMPPNHGTFTPYQWRRYVMRWCEKIRPGIHELSGVSHVKTALEAAVWTNDFVSYQWILSNAAGPIPISWIREHIHVNARNHGNTAMIDAQFARLNMANQANRRFLQQVARSAIQWNHAALAAHMYEMVIDDAFEHIPPHNPEDDTDDEWTRADAAAHVGGYVFGSLQWEDLALSIATLGALEAVAYPTRGHMKSMLILAATSELPEVMRALDARYKYTAEEAASIPRADDSEAHELLLEWARR